VQRLFHAQEAHILDLQVDLRYYHVYQHLQGIMLTYPEALYQVSSAMRVSTVQEGLHRLVQQTGLLEDRVDQDNIVLKGPQTRLLVLWVVLRHRFPKQYAIFAQQALTARQQI
jgi:hypothetical protein